MGGMDTLMKNCKQPKVLFLWFPPHLVLPWEDQVAHLQLNNPVRTFTHILSCFKESINEGQIYV